MAQSLRTIRDLAAVVTLVLTFVGGLSGGLAHAKPATDRASDSADPYDAAREAEARLDYKAVIIHATSALEMANSHERLVNLYTLLGTANGVLGKNDDAIDAFTRLLAIDPEHHLSRGVSPKITRPFKEAGGYWIDRPGGLGVVPTMPREIAGGKLLSVGVKLEDPLKMVANVRLSYRQEGTPEFAKLETPVSAAVAFTIPAEKIPSRAADYTLELYVTALGPTGSELRTAGDAAHPLLVTVRASREPTLIVDNTAATTAIVGSVPPRKGPNPILKKWWLWTAVGAVVVVGAALGGGLGWYYSRDTSHVDLSLSSKTAQ